MKVCNKCKKLMPISNFYKRKARNGSPISECKECSTERVRSVNRKRKIDILNAYGGCFCACCGETEISFLSIDHIYNDGAKHRREIFGGDGRSGEMYSWLKRNQFPTPDRFQVLCGNCQWGKRSNKGICPHKIKYAENINSLSNN